MTYKLVLQTEAISDINEGFIWYEEQLPGLGYELLQEIETSFDKLCQHPFLYTSINEYLRRIKVSRSLLIVYEVENEYVYINSVKHSSRKPRY
jgi:toxin ParE1/3/4